LARGELHCIGATTLDEYKKHVEKDAALARRFQPVFVSEPSVEDTISILRGLKEKYELHHGVRYTDGALVAAAKLSARYINDRYLPDKAIDLMDEAAARLKMQIDSKPEELDSIDREIMRLKIEQEALRKETDAASRDRLRQLEKELAGLEEQSDALTTRWSAEKEQLNQAKILQTKLDEARQDLAKAQRRGEFQLAGELAYGRIPELEGKLKAIDIQKTVTPDNIAQVVSRWTGIPIDRMLEGEKEKLLRMEEALSKRVVGQNEAVKAVSTAVRRARAGLQDPHRPIGSFMFLGPTGVGKTELTKALAQFLFDDEAAMIRLDMSEYMEKHSVARLIGAPPGYVGYEEGGALTEAVRRRPYQVVLFDEIEKAHPDVFNVLLQVLDDGRLTDGQGHTVDFRNTLIVMTSNLGAEFLVNQPEGQDTDAVRGEVMSLVRASFRPEFLNRVDEIILFHRLKRDDMDRIVSIQMGRLEKLLEDRKITLVLEPDARDFLAQKGWDPAYGARPLKRVIQKEVQDPLAERILSGDIKDGETVIITAGADQLEFTPQAAAAAAA
jgi:ATP-dependent Clp protease ATP-binding subunit ClpB